VWRSNGSEAGTVLVSDIDKGGAFFVPRKGDANLRSGTLTLKVRTAGAGKLVVGAPRGDLLKEATYHPRKAGRTEVTLRPDAAGQRKLERALREAHRHGRQVGKVAVRARFTFTPCGGVPSTQVHRFTLMIR